MHSCYIGVCVFVCMYVHVCACVFRFLIQVLGSQPARSTPLARHKTGSWHKRMGGLTVKDTGAKAGAKTVDTDEVGSYCFSLQASTVTRILSLYWTYYDPMMMATSSYLELFASQQHNTGCKKRQQVSRRPYFGTALLWATCYCQNANMLTMTCWRLAGVMVQYVEPNFMAIHPTVKTFHTHTKKTCWWC